MSMTEGIHHSDWLEEVQWLVEVNYTGKNLGTQDTEKIEGLGKCLTHLRTFVYLSILNVRFKWIKTPLSDYSFICFSREMVKISIKIIFDRKNFTQSFSTSWPQNIFLTRFHQVLCWSGCNLGGWWLSNEDSLSKWILSLTLSGLLRETLFSLLWYYFISFLKI